MDFVNVGGCDMTKVQRGKLLGASYEVIGRIAGRTWSWHMLREGASCIVAQRCANARGD